MNVSLTPELEQMVSDKVGSGLYTSASEVVREALRLLKERDDFQLQRLDALRHDVQIGLDQLKRGEATTYADSTDLKQLFEQVKARGVERLARERHK